MCHDTSSIMQRRNPALQTVSRDQYDPEISHSFRRAKFCTAVIMDITYPINHNTSV